MATSNDHQFEEKFPSVRKFNHGFRSTGVMLRLPPVIHSGHVLGILAFEPLFVRKVNNLSHTCLTKLHLKYGTFVICFQFTLKIWEIWNLF